MARPSDHGPDADRDSAGSPDRFGYSWAIFSEVLPIHELQFARWTAALDPALWQGARVLDVGCGMGRNTHWAMTKGAASAVAIDIDERSLAGAKANLERWETAEARFMSAHEIAFEDEFDVAFSIGVIHHLDDQEGAVRQMARAAKPGGRVMVWLYGRENNGWIIHLFNPVRRLLFSRLPLKLVFWLSLPLTALLWLMLRVGWGRLAYHDLLRKLSFRHLRAIVFDHMIPEIARYYTRDEAVALLEQAGLTDVSAVWVNEMSWSVVGTKPSR